MSDNANPGLGGVSKLILAALIFLALVAILYLAMFTLTIAVIAIIEAQVGTIDIGAFLFLVIFWLVPLVIDLLVIMHVNKMRVALSNNDIVALKSLNSIGWGVLALLFSGIVPGILLLVAHRKINKLASLYHAPLKKIFKMRKNLMVHATDDGLIFMIGNTYSPLVRYSDILRVVYIRRRDVDAIIKGLIYIMSAIFFIVWIFMLINGLNQAYSSYSEGSSFPTSLLYVMSPFIVIGIIMVIAGAVAEHRLVIYVRGHMEPITLNGPKSEVASLFNVIKERMALVNAERGSLQSTVNRAFEELEVRPYTGDETS